MLETKAIATDIIISVEDKESHTENLATHTQGKVWVTAAAWLQFGPSQLSQIPISLIDGAWMQPKPNPTSEHIIRIAGENSTRKIPEGLMLVD